jgi:branched-chain amino acid transport system substrate-binding protein
MTLMLTGTALPKFDSYPADGPSAFRRSQAQSREPDVSRNGSTRKLCLAAAAFVLAWAAFPVPSARAQDKVLRIGVLTDMTSVSADIMGAGSVLAAQMAAEDAGGSVAGLKIEIIGGDHQQKPDVAVSVARRWIEENKVDAIVDIPNTSVALAINQIARDANIVFMPSSSGGLALTAAQCSPNTVRWTQDVWAGATAIPRALMEGGANKTWYWIRPDVAFGADSVKMATKAIEQLGGKVVGSVAHPVGTTDFSSFVLQAKSSGANVVGIASFSDDLTNILKVSAEFGVMRGGQKIASNILTINNVRAAGLNLTQGLYTATPFYWDLNEGTRAFAERFNPRHPKKIVVNEYTAGVYSTVRHYLKAVAALGSAKDGRAVVAKMKEIPVDDPLFGKGQIRADGSVTHPMYLFQVKAPSESKGEWDYYKLIATLSPEQAFGPLDPACPLVK